MEKWQKILVAAGGAAGAAAVLYFLFRDEPGAEPGTLQPASETKALSQNSSKSEVIAQLQTMVERKQKAKGVQRSLLALSGQAAKQSLKFDDIYGKVATIFKEMPDVLAEQGSPTQAEFEMIVEKFHTDPEVMVLIQSLVRDDEIMGRASSQKVQSITVEKIFEVNEYMLTELNGLAEEFKQRKSPTKCDANTGLMTFQTLLDAKVISKFGLESADMQAAMIMHQEKLSSNAEFIRLTQNMQMQMELLFSSFETNASPSFSPDVD